MEYNTHSTSDHTPPYRGDSNCNKTNIALAMPTRFSLQKLLSTLFFIIACPACLLCAVGFTCRSKNNKERPNTTHKHQAIRPLNNSRQNTEKKLAQQPTKGINGLGSYNNITDPNPLYKRNNDTIHQFYHSSALSRQSSIDSGIGPDAESERSSLKNDQLLDALAQPKGNNAPAQDHSIAANANQESTKETEQRQPDTDATYTRSLCSNTSNYIKTFITLQKEVIEIMKRKTVCLSNDALQKTIRQLLDDTLQNTITPLSSQEIESALTHISNLEAGTEGYEQLDNKAFTKDITQATIAIEKLATTVYDQNKNIPKYLSLSLSLDAFYQQAFLLIDSLEYIEYMLKLQPTDYNPKELLTKNAMQVKEMQAKQLNNITKLKDSALNLKDRLTKANQSLEKLEKLDQIEEDLENLIINNNDLRPNIAPLIANQESLSRLIQKVNGIQDLASRLEKEIRPEAEKMIKEAKEIIKQVEKIIEEVKEMIKQAEEMQQLIQLIEPCYDSGYEEAYA
ncbi:hypothetical protein [Cardinium endosymbiont of Nabis limbatus]|uniref:hypothetical protein n=1 Tax=Cardinium endosymbiont of Nabis limbatus TaxID=3066217 RepID=UPI003AF3EB79